MPTATATPVLMVEWLDAVTVAGLFKISTKTLGKWVRGRVKGFPQPLQAGPRGRLRFKGDEIRAFLATKGGWACAAAS
jgi:hypothetical protein